VAAATKPSLSTLSDSAGPSQTEPTDRKSLVDSGATKNMKPAATGLKDYDEGDNGVTIDNGDTLRPDAAPLRRQRRWLAT